MMTSSGEESDTFTETGSPLSIDVGYLEFGPNGTIRHDRQDVSSDISSDGTGYYSIDSSGSTRTFTLSSDDAVDGKEINVKRNGGNNVNINTEGSETIDGASSTPQYTLGSDDESVTLVFNLTNTDWEIY